MRPSVSVVVPFRGNASDQRRTVRALGRLDLGPGDEVVVVDNTDEGLSWTDGRIRAVRAACERSSYHARNVGARAARNEWILFLDADCVPSPVLLDAYLLEPAPERCGALAGEVVGDPDQGAFLARYARSRRILSQREGLHATKTTAATANLLVRRAAFEDLGGFTEGIRSAGDIDFCLRLARAGWTLERRPVALVEHRHREGLIPFLGAIARYAAGARWLGERYPGMPGPWPLIGGLVGSVRDVAGHALNGRLEPALFRAVDGIGLVAHQVGYRMTNDAPRRA